MSNVSNSEASFGSDTRAEIAALRETIETLMKERVAPAVDAVAERAGIAAKSAADKVRHQATRLSDAVRDQPFMALGLAAAIGFVAAALIRR